MPADAGSQTLDQAQKRLRLSETTGEPVLADPVGEGEAYDSNKPTEENDNRGL